MTAASRGLARRRHASAGASDFLVFRVAGSAHAMRVSVLREIVKSARLTPVPRAPETVIGITSFRGRVVTVLDLARCLGLGPSSRTSSDAAGGQRARVLMVEVASEIVGFAVDEVLQVRRLGEEHVESAQVALGPDAPAHFLGVARPGEGPQADTIVLLDPGALLP